MGFSEDGVTREVHPTAHVNGSAVFVGEFSTDYFTPSWCWVPMLRRNYINGSVEWFGVPDFLRNDAPPWTLNLLYPYANWGDRGSSNNPSWVSGSGGHSDGIAILCNRPVSFQFTTGGSLKTCAVLRAAPERISVCRTSRAACKFLPISANPSAVV